MNPRSPWPPLMLAARLSSAMPAFSSVCAIWARRTSPFVSRSVLSGEITPSSIRRSMYRRSTPDRLAASAREYPATRPGYWPADPAHGPPRQGISQLLHNESLTYLAFQVLGQQFEGLSADVFLLWLAPRCS